MWRVLVIDDELSQRRVMELALADDKGLEVRGVADSATALSAARRFRPDMILLDLCMPGLDGKGLLCLLKQDPATRRTPVLVVTGRSSQREEALLRSLGAKDFLVKPFTPAELRARVRAALHPPIATRSG